MSLFSARLVAALLLLGASGPGSSAGNDGYPADDSHNHDGSHPDSPADCGGNYMLPGDVARLGSHSFMILGRDGEDHVIASHRSGTPPHNYQFLLRVRLDASEMAAYETLLAGAKTLPAFTTIYFDESGKQLDRTFFCLQDLPAIFGSERKKGDAFQKLFPIRASLQKNPDHEGTFDIEGSISRGDHFSIEREDVELLVYRYLPAYLPQDALRKAIREREKEVVPLFAHAPISFNEARETASKRSSYMATDGSIAAPGKFCPRNYYLKDTPVPETIHTFLLLSEAGKSSVLATHYYDQAPQNFQTVLKLTLSDGEMKVYRNARKGSTVPPVLQTRVVTGKATTSTFCMENIRDLVSTGKFAVRGTIYKDSTLDAWKPGKPAGTIDLTSTEVEVLVNRRLESLMNPLDVAKDVLAKP